MNAFKCPNCSEKMGAFSALRLISFHQSTCSHCGATVRALRKGKIIAFFHATTSLLAGLFSPIVLGHAPLFAFFLVLFVSGALYDFFKSEKVTIAK